MLNRMTQKRLCASTTFSLWLFFTQVYGHVLTCLWTSDPIYKVYFSLDSKGEYTAIAGLKKDGRLNSENEMQVYISQLLRLTRTFIKLRLIAAIMANNNVGYRRGNQIEIVSVYQRY